MRDTVWFAQLPFRKPLLVTLEDEEVFGLRTSPAAPTWP